MYVIHIKSDRESKPNVNEVKISQTKINMCISGKELNAHNGR